MKPEPFDPAAAPLAADVEGHGLLDSLDFLKYHLKEPFGCGDRGGGSETSGGGSGRGWQQRVRLGRAWPKAQQLLTREGR